MLLFYYTNRISLIFIFVFWDIVIKIYFCVLFAYYQEWSETMCLMDLIELVNEKNQAITTNN